jgi:hypothetical protein
MALLTPQDLKYTYVWGRKLHQQEKIQGMPKKHFLNKKDGNEIIQFINYFCRIHGFKDKSEALIIEVLIHEAMPKEELTKIETMNVLKTKLDYFLSSEI